MGSSFKVVKIEGSEKCDMGEEEIKCLQDGAGYDA